MTDGGSLPEDLKAIYRRRFTADVAWRRQMWAILCKQIFQRYVESSSVVLEVGAGYCEFINSIDAAAKIAVDVNPDTRVYAAPDVQVVTTSVTDLSAIGSGTVDVAFASNLFEHLTREEILLTMREVRRVLHADGKFLILQPNIRFCARDYWMFFDHITPLDHHSLAEALEIAGLQVVHTIVRFLPFTTRSRLPKSCILLRIYLRVPALWRIFGQQSFVVARPRAGGQER